jgi:hypothetical protein
MPDPATPVMLSCPIVEELAVYHNMDRQRLYPPDSESILQRKMGPSSRALGPFL